MPHVSHISKFQVPDPKTGVTQPQHHVISCPGFASHPLILPAAWSKSSNCHIFSFFLNVINVETIDLNRLQEGMTYFN